MVSLDRSQMYREHHCAVHLSVIHVESCNLDPLPRSLESDANTNASCIAIVVDSQSLGCLMDTTKASVNWRSGTRIDEHHIVSSHQVKKRLFV